MQNFEIWRNHLGTIVSCRDCDVPGYVLLVPTQACHKFSEADPQFLIKLGPILSAIELALIEVTGAEHVYVVRFSEAINDLHFHLFPRTKTISQLFCYDTGCAPESINGPLLFAWARTKFAVNTSAKTSDSTQKIARELREILIKLLPN